MTDPLKIWTIETKKLDICCYFPYSRIHDGLLSFLFLVHKSWIIGNAINYEGVWSFHGRLNFELEIVWVSIESILVWLISSHSQTNFIVVNLPKMNILMYIK